MDRQPTLEGARLLLRPLVADDWGALFSIVADPLLWEQHPAHDRWQEPVFRAFFDDALVQGGALAVIDKANDRLIGSSRFQGHDTLHGGSVEIGWTLLARDCWGGGYNGELKRLMLAHAFLYVSSVIFRVGETNLRSRRAMEKIGGRLTDEREEVEFPDGRTITHVIYRINRPSFAGARPAGFAFA